MKRKGKRIKGLILALATAAVLVPAASGNVDFGRSGGKADWSGVPSQADYSGLSPQALKAMNDRWTKLAQSYQHAGETSGSYGGLYPGSGAGPGSTVAGPARPDDRAGLRGVGTDTVASDYVDRQLAKLQAKAALHVDDRAGVRGPGPVETPVVSSQRDGFDWTDAGIGASIAAFAAALLAGASITRRRAGLAA